MKSNFYKTTDVETTSDTSIVVRRSFNASKDLVYKAFTTPALLRRWMGAMPGWEMTICEMDMKEGGKYHWAWKNTEQKMEFGFIGKFNKVSPLQQLVQTQTFDPGTMGGDMGKECLITMTFTEADGKTTVAEEIRYQSAEDMKQALSTGMTDGIEVSYANLDTVLTKEA